MSKRLWIGSAALVVTVHWALLWGPWSWTSTRPTFNPDTPTALDAIWIPLPLPQAEVVPKPMERPQASPQKKATKPPAAARPRTVPVKTLAPDPPSAADINAATIPHDTPQTIASAPVEAEAAPVNTDTDTNMANAAATGPRWQVQDASGASVTIALPIDGSALPQHQLLRFQVEGWIKGMQYHAQAELEWHTEGARYQARQRISAFLLGSMEQTSAGLLTPQGLQPQVFTDRRFAKKRTVALDWKAYQASFTPARPATPIGPGTQDRLSVFLQLAAILQSTPDLRAAGTRITIPTLGSRRMQLWTFEVQAPEILSLPGGASPTLRLRRIPQTGDAEQALLWLHATQGYAPVRIHLEESNGDVMDFVRKD